MRKHESIIWLIVLYVMIITAILNFLFIRASFDEAPMDKVHLLMWIYGILAFGIIAMITRKAIQEKRQIDKRF